LRVIVTTRFAGEERRRPTRVEKLDLNLGDGQEHGQEEVRQYHVCQLRPHLTTTLQLISDASRHLSIPSMEWVRKSNAQVDLQKVVYSALLLYYVARARREPLSKPNCPL
jgi:hypothetical protein